MIHKEIMGFFKKCFCRIFLVNSLFRRTCKMILIWSVLKKYEVVHFLVRATFSTFFTMLHRTRKHSCIFLEHYSGGTVRNTTPTCTPWCTRGPPKPHDTLLHFQRHPVQPPGTNQTSAVSLFIILCLVISLRLQPMLLMLQTCKTDLLEIIIMQSEIRPICTSLSEWLNIKNREICSYSPLPYTGSVIRVRSLLSYPWTFLLKPPT